MKSWMIQAPMHASRDFKSGFSLVEIALSLAIAAFALVAMLGLINIGFASGKRAGDDTVLTSMTSVIVGKIRADTSITSTTPAITSSPYYFDGEGTITTATTAGVLYSCEAALRQPTTEELPEVGNNFSILTLTFSWPINAPSDHRTKEIIHASIPR